MKRHCDRRRDRRGFTLVELLVAMALTGLLAVITYSMFGSTADMLGEVDSLADTSDHVRFSLERVRTDLQMAGAQSTPDSECDIWVRPASTAYHVAGVYPYPAASPDEAWQDDRSVLDSDVANANPHVSFDGFVVMGAYDYPLGVEMRHFIEGDPSVWIEGHHRGLYRMHVADPFNTAIEYPVDFTSQSDIEVFQPQWTSRLVRVSDRRGYYQFAEIAQPIDPSTDHQSGAALDWPYMIVTLNGSRLPVYKDSGAHYGLEPDPTGDTGYDSAFLDAYWYHVIADPNDPANYILVRDRLCAPAVANEFKTNLASFHPAKNLADQCPNGEEERVIISDRVVDFQVWFDCTTQAKGGDITADAWESRWLTPAGGACMDPGSPQIGNARVAHVRLTLRAENERSNLRHFQFETSAGATCDPDDPSTCDPTTMADGHVALRTFDAHPAAPGATPVITAQTDIELVNFANRNTVCP